jgi:hypothetical protein
MAHLDTAYQGVSAAVRTARALHPSDDHHALALFRRSTVRSYRPTRALGGLGSRRVSSAAVRRTGRRPYVVPSVLLSLLACGCNGSSSPRESNRVDGDAGLPSDSSNADSSNTDAHAGPFCTTALPPNAAPATLDDVPVADWCAAAPGRIVEWTCEGITAIAIGIGGDCDREFLFDAGSRRLVAVVGGCNGQQSCSAGNPSFEPPTECWSGNISFGVTNVCDEAGLPDAGPDGAGALCSSNAQCPAGYVCGYSTSSPCYSQGFCVYGDFGRDPTCSPTTYCACDGTLTQGCVGAYALKPVPTRGQQTFCQDGG